MYTQIVEALSATTLTGAYTGAGNVSYTNNFQGAERLLLLINYTTGAAETSNTLNFKIESGPSDSDLYQSVDSSGGTGAITANQAEISLAGASAATSYKIAYPVVDMCDYTVKISFKESGVATNYGTVSLKILAVYPDKNF